MITDLAIIAAVESELPAAFLLQAVTLAVRYTLEELGIDPDSVRLFDMGDDTACEN